MNFEDLKEIYQNSTEKDKEAALFASMSVIPFWLGVSMQNYLVAASSLVFLGYGLHIYLKSEEEYQEEKRNAEVRDKVLEQNQEEQDQRKNSQRSFEEDDFPL